MKKYYLQEQRNGWKLVAVFHGTYSECEEYKEKYVREGDYHIVSEQDYKIDVA